jgi:transposase
MEPRRARRRFDKAFKADAVRMVLDGKRASTELARELGIDRSVLNRWIRELTEAGDGAFPGHGKLSPQDEEIRRLKRELERVTEERDILKKAMGVFSHRP